MTEQLTHMCTHVNTHTHTLESRVQKEGLDFGRRRKTSIETGGKNEHVDVDL